ncbi:MAG: DUF58 domain-containing protein [Hyphomicrobiaceae bacterium]
MAFATQKSKKGLAREDHIFGLESEATSLADALPDLSVEAMRIAATVAHGVHGRRRAGSGENFWQFRLFQDSDSYSQIDWRRSASSDHLYIREREWEAAHTVWLWPDISSSMAFKSHLSNTTKRDRAVVLMLATAELLAKSGERVALIGRTNPTASRRAAAKLSEILAAEAKAGTATTGMPPPIALPRYSGTVMFSDFLEPIDALTERITQIAANTVSGHLVQVLDPAEETLPYEGRTEFLGPDGNTRWIADRAESLRDTYTTRLENHREALREMAHRMGWSFMVHHTDRPASEPLLNLITRLQAPATLGGE